jgi:hypothetical protein
VPATNGFLNKRLVASVIDLLESVAARRVSERSVALTLEIPVFNNRHHIRTTTGGRTAVSAVRRERPVIYFSLSVQSV